MALGEYVSVSTQRDTERALLEKERTEPVQSAARILPMWLTRMVAHVTAHAHLC
ncbi:integral membrane protein [Mycobacteroides abscessus]|nr:integral membrane protein [Mycobacteroides abscessus]